MKKDEAGMVTPSCLFLSQTGKVDPHHPRVSGHRGNVLDIKWNPFNDYCIASCSEDATVRCLDDSLLPFIYLFFQQYEHVAAGRSFYFLFFWPSVIT